MIFGSFDEIPPAEALTVVSAETGVFTVTAPGSRDSLVYLEAGYLVAMTAESEPIQDSLRLRASFSHLLSLREGEFDFRRSALLGVDRNFHLPLGQLITSSLAFATEISGDSVELSSADACFELDRRLDLWLGDELQLFWERAEPLLRGGCNAVELAEMAGIPVDRARWYLHKLRLAGLIRPRRLVGEQFPTPRWRRKSKPAVAPSLSTTPEPELASAVENSIPALREVKLATPSRPLLLRLIQGLTTLFR